MRKLVSCSAITLSLMLVEPAFAQSSTVTLTAEFQRGAIAEYTNGANRTSNAELFSSLNISSISISQVSNDGNWGGSQGNDTSVNVTIRYTNGTTLQFPAAINWVKNTSGGGFDWVGLTTATTQNDGYVPRGGGDKTYILQFPQSTINLSTLLPDSLDGSANHGGALKALNLYFPGPGSSSLTFTSANAFSYLENSADADVIGTVQTANASGSVNYSISSGNVNNWYEIDPATGQISLTPAGVAAAEPNDFETAPNSRTITVQADDGSNVVAQSITLSETDVTEGSPITFTSGTAFSYLENSGDSNVLGTVAATGGSGALTYSIKAGNTDGWYEIDPSSGEITLTAAGVSAAANDFEGAPNAHVLTVQASDGILSGTMDVTLSELDVNEPPSFAGTNATDGGGDPSYAFSYAEGQAAGAALGQVAASDPDAGDTITFAIAGGNTNGWFQIDGTTGQVSLTAAGVAAAANDFEGAPNVHTLTVTASDSTDTTSIEVVLSETDVDEVAPVITSAASFDVDEGVTSVTTLTAHEAVTWSITGGVDAGDLSIDPTSGALTFDAVPDFEAPADDDRNNSYLIEVTATDTAGNTSVQTVTVNVLDLPDTNTAPSFAGTNATDGGGDPSYAFSYAEGQAAGAALGQVAASDPDAGDTITFAIAGGNTNGWFQIDGTTGQVSLTAAGVAAAANDFEGAPNVHTLTVTASDSTDTTSIEVVLSETDVDEVAPVITSAASFDVDEGVTSVTTLTAHEAVTWSITGGVDAGDLSIDPTSGALTFDAVPDFEAPADDDRNNSYLIEVTATDTAGNTSVQTVTVNVLDLPDTNTAPSFAGTNATDGGGDPSYAFSYAEGQAAGAALGQVAASDPDAGDTITFAIAGGNTNGWFQIDGTTGQVSLTAAGVAAAANDFEGAPNVHTLTVTASDSTDTTSIEVVLSETDVDEVAPVITSAASFDVDEGVTSVTTLTAHEAVTWSITGGVDAGDLSIDPTSGALTFDAVPDFEAPADDDRNNSYLIEVTATDTAGNTSVQTVTVNVLDLPDTNTAPSFAGTNATDGGGDPSYAFSYAEGQAAGAALGQVAASDPDAGDTITFAIAGGNTNGWFQIDGTTGQVSLTAAGVAAAANDFEGAPNVHTLTVTASDSTDTTSIEVVLSETDVDEVAPVITGPSGGSGADTGQITVDEGTSKVTQLTSDKPVTWSITGGNDQGMFSVAPDGTISFVTPPDFEAPTDSDGNNTYILTIQAEDADGNISTQTITVMVANIDDTAPVIAGPSGGPGANTGEITVDEGTSKVTQLTSDKPVTWSITGGNDQGMFSVAPDGTISFVTPPDFEAPTDSDGNNTYILTIQAVDADGNISTQTITVTVANIDDTAPEVSVEGNTMVGDKASFKVVEGATDVVTFGSDETVTWAIADGEDRGLFSIGNNGSLAFRSAPDFEAPTDRDSDNVYLLAIEATDENGNTSRILLDITVLNTEELQERVAQISDALRQGLRTHAAIGLSDLLSYNEELMIGGFDCAEDRNARNVSGSVNANEANQNANVRFENALTACGKNLRLLLDGGATISRLDGNSRVRSFASIRLEKNVSDEAQIGLNVIGSTSSASMSGFTDSDISDIGLTGQIYGRIRFDQDLMAGAFVGYGKSWYDFDLSDDGLSLGGDYAGNRFIVGGMVRGELSLGDRPLTIDAILSHASESLGNARFDADLDHESASNLTLELGDVEQTRISVPLTYSAFGPVDSSEPGTGLNLTVGGLCESEFFDRGLSCGIQSGARLYRYTLLGSYAYLDVNFENAAGLSRVRIDAGYAFDVGLGDGATVAFNVGTIGSDTSPTEMRGLVTLKASR